MLEKDDNSLYIAKTRFSHIIDTINGELVYGDADEYVKDGRVIVGAAQVDILERHVKENDIVIVSDRFEAQLAAINCGMCGCCDAYGYLCGCQTYRTEYAYRILYDKRSHHDIL